MIFIEGLISEHLCQISSLLNYCRRKNNNNKNQLTCDIAQGELT